jgi:hypothetical protein
VYAAVNAIIDSASASDMATITHESPYWALPMSFEHERIHIETSSVLLREMPLHEVCMHADTAILHVIHICMIVYTIKHV